MVELKALFQAYDLDGDGWVQWDEVRQVFGQLTPAETASWHSWSSKAENRARETVAHIASGSTMMVKPAKRRSAPGANSAAWMASRVKEVHRTHQELGMMRRKPRTPDAVRTKLNWSKINLERGASQ